MERLISEFFIIFLYFSFKINLGVNAWDRHKYDEIQWSMPKENWRKHEEDKVNTILQPTPPDVSTNGRNFIKQDKKPHDISKRTSLDTKIEEAVEDKCTRTQSCEYNSKMDTPNCYCDELCTQFNDCCYHFNASNPSLDIANTNFYPNNLDCRLNIIPDLLTNTRGYWMVTQCPNTYSDEMVTLQCNSTSMTDIPVTDDKGVVYGNLYCAQCHGVITYTPWTVQIKVDNRFCYKFIPEDLLSNLDLMTSNGFEQFRENSCTYVYIPPTRTRPRVCYPSLMVSESKKEDELCQKYLNPILIDYKNQYRNIFCVDRWSKMYCLDYGFPYTVKSHIYPLNIMFTLRPPILNRERECDREYHLDLETGLCFPGNCSRNKPMPCKTYTGILLKNYLVTVNLLLVSMDILEQSIVQKALSLFLTSLPIDTYGLLYKTGSIDLHTSTLPLIEKENGKIHSIVNATFVLTVRKPSTVDEIVGLEYGIKTLQWEYTEEMESSAKNKTFRLWRDWDLHRIDQETSNITKNITKVQWDGYLMETFVNSLKNKENLENQSDIPSYCNVTVFSKVDMGNEISNAVLDCAMRNGTEDMKNHSLIFFENASSVHDNDVSLFIQAVLTYTTLSISSAVIVPTFCINRYLSLSSTIPGHISENIMSVIFLFDITFLSGIGASANQILCLFSAVLTHYFILSLMTWISLFVVHTLYTIRRLHKPHASAPLSENKFPKQYYIIGYLSPLLIIIPAVIIDLCQCTDIEVGYQGEICFPTSYPANLVIFIFPVVISLMINLISLTYAASYLCKLNDILTHSGITNPRSYVGIYIRLCLVSGLSWSIGILSEALDNDILRFIFIIVTGLQGLIFCLCILSTRLFRESFKEKISTQSLPEEIEMKDVESDIPDQATST